MLPLAALSAVLGIQFFKYASAGVRTGKRSGISCETPPTRARKSLANTLRFSDSSKSLIFFSASATIVRSRLILSSIRLIFRSVFPLRSITILLISDFALLITLSVVKSRLKFFKNISQPSKFNIISNTARITTHHIDMLTKI